MIIRPHPTAFDLLFNCTGSVVPAVMPRILLAAALGAVAAFLRVELEGSQIDEATRFEFGPFTALGVAISLFLGFRNNASYERWWEGRKQWGAQLIAVRDFARLLAALKVNPQDRRALVRLTVAHTHAMRVQQRAMWADGHQRIRRLSPDEDPLAERNSFLEPAEQAYLLEKRNPADAILGMASARLGALHKMGSLDSYSVVAASQLLDVLSGVQGACERIANTPLPFPYVLLVARTSLFYVALAPFAMAEQMGWWTPLFNALLAYTFFGLDELARQLETPFGEEPQCLALGAVCRTIEIAAAEALGDAPPLPLKPNANYNLM